VKCAIIFLFAVAAFGQVYPNRWVYVSRNLTDDRHVEDFRNIARTAAEHGLTGILLEGGFDALDLKTQPYLERLAQIRQIAQDYGLEIIPSFYGSGYAGGILQHSRHLAEGLPVRNALYIAASGRARFSADHDTGFINGAFEDADGDKFRGYRLQDRPGAGSYVDREVFHSGEASVRFEDLGGSPAGNNRMMQEIEVKPNRQYRVSLWVRTEGLNPPTSFRMQVLNLLGLPLAPWDAKAPATSDWRKYTFGFNSGANERVRLYAGTWSGRSGAFWLDDWQVEEIGLLNVLRRPGTPLRVVGEESGFEYEEFVDFHPVADGLLNSRWDHDGPEILLLPSGRIPEGERLRVSYYHSMAVNDGQVSACMSELEAYEIWWRNVNLIQQHLNPKKFMLAIY
jgi:hypothetical protein